MDSEPAQLHTPMPGQPPMISPSLKVQNCVGVVPEATGVEYGVRLGCGQVSGQ